MRIHPPWLMGRSRTAVGSLAAGAPCRPAGTGPLWCTGSVSLRTQPARAAELIESVGWATNAECSSRGEVCLTGALRRVTEHPGDWLVTRAVFQHLGRAERWNDSPGVDRQLVTAALRAVEITPSLLHDTFGPQWAEIVHLVRVCAALTADQHVDLRRPWTQERADASVRAGQVARDAGRGAQLAAAKASVWDATRAAGGASVVDVSAASAGTTAWDAVSAVVCADLLPVADRATLVAPWNTALGRLHHL